MHIRLFATLFLIFTMMFPLSAAQPTKSPKLILVIIVDQMRRDYLDRFNDLFGEGGFRLLTEKGSRFVNCSYPYSVTYTGPGHSAILSGISPASSGIIGNDWYSLALNRIYYCAEDSMVTPVGIAAGNAAGKMSPSNFNGSSICDMLLQSSPGSKAIGIALKDRGAILPVGKHPTGAFWFDPASGNWISSSYYGSELPRWAKEFNDKETAKAYLGNEWPKSLPENAYSRQGPDNAPGEGNLPGESSNVFPHHVIDPVNASDVTLRVKFRRYDPLLCTPFGNDLTVSFAEAALAGEHLGQRGVSDILSVSFSSPDYCGHIFGPQSQEMEDMMIRLDRQLSAFFTFVDAMVGLDNVDIVLTSDHGVAPLPEQTASLGGLRMLAGDYLLDIKVHMGQMYNYNEGNDNLVRAVAAGGLWLDTVGIAAHHFSADHFTKDCACFVETLPGILKCYLPEQIETSTFSGSEDSVLSKVKRSYNRTRSAQMQFFDDVADETHEQSFRLQVSSFKFHVREID